MSAPAPTAAAAAESAVPDTSSSIRMKITDFLEKYAGAYVEAKKKEILDFCVLAISILSCCTSVLAVVLLETFVYTLIPLRAKRIMNGKS